MSKRKYFSWTDELRAELREYVDTHKKNKTEALKEAAEVFGVSLGSCNGAYACSTRVARDCCAVDIGYLFTLTGIRSDKGTLYSLFSTASGKLLALTFANGYCSQ